MCVVNANTVLLYIKGFETILVSTESLGTSHPGISRSYHVMTVFDLLY